MRSRTTPRCFRRPSANRCASSSPEKTKWRGRITDSHSRSTSAPASTRREISSRGITKRGLRCSGIARSTRIPETSSPDFWRAFSPRNSGPARPRPSLLRSATIATRFRRTWWAMWAAPIMAPARSSRSGSSCTMSSLRFGPALCVRRSACRTLSRTNLSWTSLRPAPKPIPWNFDCAT